MAVNVAAFKVSFPEFAKAGDTLLEAHLAQAALEVDAGLWGVWADNGVMLTAAHSLAMSPFGMNARMVAKDGSTTYGKKLDEKRAMVSLGNRLI